jgi:hypothetical protein
MNRVQKKWPATPSEWQEAVDLSCGLRALANCKMYGLLAGGPEIDHDRCDQLIAEGKRLGIGPSKPIPELAAYVVMAYNRTTEEDQTQ